MESSTTPQYLVQCPSVHVAEVFPGTELEKRCIARVKAGYIDALPIGPDDCFQCVGDAQYRRETELDRADGMCYNNEPDHDLFCPGCLTPEEIAKMFPSIPESKYSGQMRMAMPW